MVVGPKFASVGKGDCRWRFPQAIQQGGRVYEPRLRLSMSNTATPNFLTLKGAVSTMAYFAGI